MMTPFAFSTNIPTLPASDHYPYSQKNDDQLNYIRNSAKAVVNVYTGESAMC
jgi:uncharacterized membrane protein (UPF0182 family)